MLQGVQFTQPPPPLPNLSVPPPGHFPVNRYHVDRGAPRPHYFQPFRPYPRPGPGGPDSEFDGKRLRKSVMRKTVDYNSAIIKMLESRVWQRDFRDRRALQPDVLYYPDLMPPPSYIDNPINSVTTRFVKTATNKMRCPIFCMAWTPEGRRLVTGASSGEFTLWNGLTFNFETILQAHDSPVRTMVWSHNDVWMVTGDHAGYVKYWQSNMNNVKMFQAHKEAIRGLSFSPTDHKFVTCSDDGTLRIWDFLRCNEERILRGHGADVKCVHWHPQKGLIVSGSKDNQQPVKLWDPKTGQSLATLHAHKSTVMDIKWNNNGNWLVTASRDHLLKLFDLRNLNQEVQTFRGHKKEASSVAWHPYHEGLFCSGGSDGAILFWHVGADKEVGAIEQAHDSIVWTLAWHPLGHILCSGSNDHTSKFWTRNRPGDLMRDKYNLNTLPAGLPGLEDQDIDEPATIPGMGPEDKVDTNSTPAIAQIPGLDFEGVEDKQKQLQKKVPYSKPIPRNFQAQWNETNRQNDDTIDEDSDDDEAARAKRLALLRDPISEVITQLIETNPPPGVIPLSQLQPQAIIIYGKLLNVEGNPTLAQAIQQGPEALNRLINSGEIEELQDVIPHLDDEDYHECEEDDMEIETMSDIELPAPLPSSIFARKPKPSSSPSSEQPVFKTDAVKEFGATLPPICGGSEDKDMRMLGGHHLPNKPTPPPDQDMRFSKSDLDLRQQHNPNLGPPSHAGDQDFRRLPVDSDLRQDPSLLSNHPHMDEDLRPPLLPAPGADLDLRFGMDQDLRGGLGIQQQPMPPSQQQPLLGKGPYEGDRDFRQGLLRPPDIEHQYPQQDSLWNNGPRKRRWGDMSDERPPSPMMGAPNYSRIGRGGGSLPPGGSPSRNFHHPARGSSPSGNFLSRGGSPARNFGLLDRGSYPHDDINEGQYNQDMMDVNFSHAREEFEDNYPPRGYSPLRKGRFEDIDRGDGYHSDDQMEPRDDLDHPPGRDNGHESWGGDRFHNQRGYHHPSEGGYRGRGYPPRGRSVYEPHRGGGSNLMRGGHNRGRFSSGTRGRGSRRAGMF